MRAQIILLASLWMAACVEGEDPNPDPSTPDASMPDPPASSCDPTAVIDRVWEFSSNNTFFFLRLDADGTYRREMDAPPATVRCEYGQWRASACGIEFQTCRGTVETRQWSASPTAFVLDQTTYRPSALNAETAFSFCDIDECN